MKKQIFISLSIILQISCGLDTNINNGIKSINKVKPTATPTTIVPSYTSSPTPHTTVAPTSTFTATASPTVIGNTFTPTPTATSTFTATATPTFTQTATNTFTATPTYTPTFTPTYTNTPTATYTSTPTFTTTPSPTPNPCYAFSYGMGANSIRVLGATEFCARPVTASGMTTQYFSNASNYHTVRRIASTNNNTCNLNGSASSAWRFYSKELLSNNNYTYQFDWNIDPLLQASCSNTTGFNGSVSLAILSENPDYYVWKIGCQVEYDYNGKIKSLRGESRVGAYLTPTVNHNYLGQVAHTRPISINIKYNVSNKEFSCSVYNLNNQLLLYAEFIDPLPNTPTQFRVGIHTMLPNFAFQNKWVEHIYMNFY